jgi:hypothetical protein
MVTDISEEGAACTFRTTDFLHYPENGGSKLLQNVRKYEYLSTLLTHDIPKDFHRHKHVCENLKSRKLHVCFPRQFVINICDVEYISGAICILVRNGVTSLWAHGMSSLCILLQLVMIIIL